MRKKRMLLVACVPLLLASGYVLPSLAVPRHSITSESFARLKVGITKAEVELILGVPPGDYRAVPGGSSDGGLGPGDSFGPVGEPVERYWWYCDSYWVQVVFDARGMVVGGYGGWPVTSPEPFFAKVRRWLRL